jgi:hypothetical protein
MFPNRNPASLVSRPLNIRSHAAKGLRRIQIATVKRTYVHGGKMEVGIHRYFFGVCFEMVCSNGPETLPPLVDQRVTASKPVHDVFRERESSRSTTAGCRRPHEPREPANRCASRRSCGNGIRGRERVGISSDAMRTGYELNEKDDDRKIPNPHNAIACAHPTGPRT